MTEELRQAAANAIEQALDQSLCSAVSEPARVEIIKILMRNGPSDIAGIATHLQQDRSVVSRHLKHLHSAGLTRMRKEGRHRVYELEGAGIVRRLDAMAATIRRVMTVCCADQLSELKADR